MVWAAVEWFSVGVYSGIRESRRVSAVTGTAVWATPTAQSAVGEPATNVPTETGNAQREQSQAQMETLTNLGAVQVAKTTYDARDFQTKTFSKMKERFQG